ncbi:MAG: hypothetical protein HYR85_23655 [Planctomycetes bacterium]|nr:hypothetical protein [Planctomycetota bacterium]MBI3844052.1 hypothetical protein [Planctomycetota bacterium]
MSGIHDGRNFEFPLRADGNVGRMTLPWIGHYHAVIYTSGLASDEVDFDAHAPSKTRIDVELYPGSAIILRLTESPGVPRARDAHVVLRDDGGRIVRDVHIGRVGSGLSTVFGLRPGFYRVEATTDSALRADGTIESAGTTNAWILVDLPLR